jgi:hypothetical protein
MQLNKLLPSCQHLIFISQQLAVPSSTYCYCRFERIFCIGQVLMKFAGVLNTVVLIDFDYSLTVELPFFLFKQVLFLSSCLLHCVDFGSSGSVLQLDRPRSCAVLFLINLVKPLVVILFLRVAHGVGGYLLCFFFSFIPKFI